MKSIQGMPTMKKYEISKLKINLMFSKIKLWFDFCFIQMNSTNIEPLLEGIKLSETRFIELSQIGELHLLLSIKKYDR